MSYQRDHARDEWVMVSVSGQGSISTLTLTDEHAREAGQRRRPIGYVQPVTEPVPEPAPSRHAGGWAKR